KQKAFERQQKEIEANSALLAKENQRTLEEQQAARDAAISNAQLAKADYEEWKKQQDKLTEERLKDDEQYQKTIAKLNEQLKLEKQKAFERQQKEIEANSALLAKENQRTLEEQQAARDAAISNAQLAQADYEKWKQEQIKLRDKLAKEEEKHTAQLEAYNAKVEKQKEKEAYKKAKADAKQQKYIETLNQIVLLEEQNKRMLAISSERLAENDRMEWEKEQQKIKARKDKINRKQSLEIDKFNNDIKAQVTKRALQKQKIDEKHSAKIEKENNKTQLRTLKAQLKNHKKYTRSVSNRKVKKSETKRQKSVQKIQNKNRTKEDARN
ncbi:MAG: hypothetical protein MI922_20210, partial [Bacteroidales bacterium]|nr:hypothetical protein [Bacteroidales bacterium]